MRSLTTCFKVCIRSGAKAPSILKYLLLALPFIATAAHANCPTSAHLEGGIRLIDEEGWMVIYRGGSSPHSVEIAAIDDNGASQRVILKRGVYLSQAYEVKDDIPLNKTRTSWTYPVTAEDMPVLKPGETWETYVVLREPDSLEIEKQQWRALQETTMKIGECSYPAVPLISENEDQTREFLNYLPTLGFAVVAAYEHSDYLEKYTYQRIEAIE